MKMRYEMPTGYKIKRRTFEGKEDETKNDSSLTSKYMPSYKYWMIIYYPHNTNGIQNCYRTKTDAEAAYQTAISKAGTYL